VANALFSLLSPPDSVAGIAFEFAGESSIK
jgi:hypothetical protein